MADAGENAVETLEEKLSKAIGTFGAQLGSNKLGTLAQAWVPEASEDGGVVLNTQGLPFCVIGAADLLALFRCISCKYKFSTDTTKPWLMGAVGRVYTSGEPEIAQNVQQYDQSVYLRVAEAQRCHIHFCLFLPVYGSSSRDRVVAVLEVVQTEQNSRFSGLIDWARVCLEGAGLWTLEGDGENLPIGLRSINPGFEVSAFESKVEMRRTAVMAPSMPPPPPTVLRDKGPAPSTNNHSLNSVQPLEFGGTAAAAVVANELQFSNQQPEKDSSVLPNSDVGLPTQEKIVQIGNSLLLHSDAVAGAQWQQHVAALQGGASGSGGSTDPATMQQLNPATNWNLGALNNPLPPLPPIPQQQQQQQQQQFALSYGQGDRVVTLEDLAPHFNVSLREAAGRLGISVTTLKRACRRLGLQRWPRREIAARAQEVAKAAAMAATVAGTASDPTNIFNWMSSQTISADSSGEQQHLLGTAAAAGGPGLLGLGHPFGGPPGGHHFMPTTAGPINPNAALMNPMFGNIGGGGAPLPPGFGPTATATTGKNLAETQTHSLESLDILAAADGRETFSVGNSAGNGLFSTGAMMPLQLGTAAAAAIGVKDEDHGLGAVPDGGTNGQPEDALAAS